MNLKLTTDVIGATIARINEFLLPLRRATCSHRFDPADMENHRELDGTIKWTCWRCREQFSEDCGIDVLARGSVEKRPDRHGELWGCTR
jgi:hypothetical protein